MTLGEAFAIAFVDVLVACSPVAFFAIPFAVVAYLRDRSIAREDATRTMELAAWNRGQRFNPHRVRPWRDPNPPKVGDPIRQIKNYGGAYSPTRKIDLARVILPKSPSALKPPRVVG